MAEKKEVKRFTTPEGRLIYSALFERDVFKADNGAEGKPAYRATVALDPNDEATKALIDEVFNLAADEWGDNVQLNIDGGNIGSPFVDGSVAAKKREEKGKPGDAMKGLILLKADTQFNRDGEMAPGGVAVYGPDVSLVTPVNKDQVYNGCYGVLAVTFKTWTVNKDKGVKAHLVAFQKTRDGERLSSPADHSTLFKPVGRTAAASGGEATTRRRRAG